MIDLKREDLFLSYIKETLLDYTTGPSDSSTKLMVESLENIIQKKALTLQNISPLYIYLDKAVTEPDYYKKQTLALNSLGVKEEKSNTIIIALKIEHNFMHKFISRSFRIESLAGTGASVVSVK